MLVTTGECKGMGGFVAGVMYELHLCLIFNSPVHLIQRIHLIIESPDDQVVEAICEVLIILEINVKKEYMQGGVIGPVDRIDPGVLIGAFTFGTI